MKSIKWLAIFFFLISCKGFSQNGANGPNPHNIIYTTWEIGAGAFIGFKGSTGTVWRTIGSDNDDWSGCYLGSDIAVSEGYIAEEPSSTATIWMVYAKVPITVHEFSGEFMQNSSILGPEKAAAIKAYLEIDPGENLVGYFGKSGGIYEGPSADVPGLKELAMSWSMVESSLEPEPLREYKIDARYDPVAWRPAGSDEPWNNDYKARPMALDHLLRQHSAHRTNTIHHP